MSRAPLVLVGAGGTGGHVYPALAVALELRERGYRIAWVGTRAGLEARVVPEHDIEMHYLPVRGVRGKSFGQKVRALFMLTIAVTRGTWLVLRQRPACVMGMGGYAAGPAGIAAWLLRKPLLIHEQNALAGTTNRMLAPFARRIVAGFSGAFGEEREPLVTGNPVRSDLVAAGSRPHYDYDGTRPLRLLVLGGSLGAAPINVILPGTLRRMLRDRHGSLEVWHQTGAAHHEEMEERYAGMRDVSAKVVPFIEDMAAAYQWADIVLCRAGALTVSELAVMGRPSILVPLPQAVDDHQTLNAKWLANTGAAFVMLQSQLDAYSLGDLLERLMDDPQELAAMSEAAYAAATPDATRRIADCCEELIHGG